MKYFVLPAVLCLAVALCVAGISVTYNAAVVEYTALYSPTVVSSREEALSIEFGNLIIMESYMKQAKAKGVQIIVFPEYGVYGATPFETRDDVLPFAEPVPDPAQSESVLNPCNFPSEFPQSQLLVKASCLAASQKMALVIDMASVEYCNATNPPTPDCPSDGRFQYNTQVAFDEFGALVGRYRKFHLYYEPWFDSPPTPDVSYFTTQFGVTFAMIICFDVNFGTPSQDYFPAATANGNHPYPNVFDIVISQWWVNESPFQAAVEVQQSFSRAYSTNVLASGNGASAFRSSGSGIYAGAQGNGGAVVAAYFASNQSTPVTPAGGVLLTGQLSTTSTTSSSSLVRNRISSSSSSSSSSSADVKGQRVDSKKEFRGTYLWQLAQMMEDASKKADAILSSSSSSSSLLSAVDYAEKKEKLMDQLLPPSSSASVSSSSFLEPIWSNAVEIATLEYQLNSIDQSVLGSPSQQVQMHRQRLAELKQQQKSLHLDGLVRAHRFKAVSAYQGQNVYLFLENSPFQCNFSYVLAPYAPAIVGGNSNSNNDTEYLMLAMDVPKVPGVIPAPTRGCFFTQCTGLDCSFGQRTAMNRLGQTFSKIMLAGWGFSGDYVVMPQVLSVPNINNNFYPAGLMSPSSIVVETNDLNGTLQTEMQLNGIELMNAILWQVPEM